MNTQDQKREGLASIVNDGQDCPREDLLGQRLLKDQVVTDRQLESALLRQKVYGGKLGQNLLALGLLSGTQVSQLFRNDPPEPKTIEETGLSLSFICDLILKQIAFIGEFTSADVSYSVKLPINIVTAALDELKREKFIEIKGAAQFAKGSYRYQITGQGKNRAVESLELCRYAGPAPVTLAQYKEIIEIQTVKNIILSEDSLNAAFSIYVINPKLLKKLGPALTSGKAIFLYGPPGNGKTTIAETLGNVLPGTVYIPYSLVTGGQIISIFDPGTHRVATPEGEPRSTDRRWISIRRPVVTVGGELTIKLLNLDFNPISKFYEAPLQMKANNGLFIVDDFGRQEIGPVNLLNRWIMPLERRRDFMSFHTGMKFEIPFDQIVIFATNIDPSKLMDEAFFRRIRNKIRIDYPTKEEYEAIFRSVCETNLIEFERDIFDHLIKNYYERLGINLSACHPRDLIDHIADEGRYYGRPLRLTEESIAMAWENYFVEM